MNFNKNLNIKKKNFIKLLLEAKSTNKSSVKEM